MKRKNLILAGLIAAFSLSATLATANLLQNENANVAYAEEVAESTADFAMINGASVRYSVGTTGMRFQAYMTEAKYTEVMKADSVTFGMVILPYEYVTTYGAVSEETLFGENAKYVGNVQEKGKQTVLEYKATELDLTTGNRGEGRYFNCAIVNILPSNYEKEFYATAYYAATTNGVTTYEFTAANETNRRTVEYVSTVAMTKDTNMTNEKLSILNGFAYRGDSGADKAEGFEGGQIENDIYVSAKAKNVTLSAIDSTLETVAIAEENGGVKISGDTAGSGFGLSLKNVKAGQKYTLTFTAKASGLTDGFTLNSYHYKNGAKYDGIVQYDKSYTVTALTAELAEYSVNVETAAIGYDEIVLNFVQGSVGAYELILDEIALVEAKNIEITEIPAKNQLVAGASVELDAKLNGLQGVLTWKSSNENVAKVSKTGVLTAVAAGKAEITATLTSGETTYEDYFALYVLPETADANKVELVYEPSLPVDFVLNVPAGRDIRILQLTDTQIVDPTQIREGASNALAATLIRSWSGEDAVEGNCLDYIDRVFSKIETTPDLVVLTGDNTYGKFDDNGKMLDKVIAALEEKGVYWTFAFGNHDKESDIGIEAMLRKYANAEHCLYAYRNVTGDSNVSIAVKQGNEYTRLLFTFDTNSTGANRVDTYALVYQGVYQSQRDWYTATVTEFLNKTGKTSIPSSVFLHIPFQAVVTALDALGDMATGFEIEDETGTNFGGCYSEIGGWDTDNSFFNMLKTYGTDGVFMGHYHKVNASVVYEGVRFTFGTKTGTYDEYQQGMLGGTMIEANATNCTVEHVYAVEKNVEDYDLAREYQDNNLRTSTFWTASMHFDLTVTDQDLPEGGSGKAMKATKNEGDTGWAYLRFRLLPLKAGQYYKLSFNVNFATANDYGNTFAFNGYITPNAEITASEKIGTVPTTTKDGLIEIYFTSPTDTTTSSLKLEFFNWNNGGLNDYFTLDNLKLEESVWSASKIENDDGTFSGQTGNISVLAATEISGSADDGWASAVTLFKTDDPAMTPNGTTDTALRVTSSGGHNWSFVYIKFNTPIVKDTPYTIAFDAKWNGIENPVGFHYSIDKGNGSNAEQLVDYQGIAYNNLFKAGNTITFTSPESVEYFYLRIISNSNESEATRTPFDFTIDNIKLSVHSINTDGTFEGTAGNVTLLSNKNTEITESNAVYVNAKSTYLTRVTKNGNTSIHVRSVGAGNSFFFIKFNQAITAGKTYTITFDAEWNSEAAFTEGFYRAFASDPNVTGDIKGYANVKKADLFKKGASLSFSPNADYEFFYLRLHINTSTFGFDFTIDNIAITEA